MTALPAETPEFHPFTPAVISRSVDHRYTFQGQTYPGVTSILDNVLGANFGTAAYYGAKQAAELVVKFMQDDPKTLDSMFATLGPQGMVPALANAARKHRDAAASLGTEVHAMADLVVQGKPTPSMDEPTRKRVLKYAEWWKASGWKLRLSEAMVVNPASGYGGTFDLLAYDRDGRTVLADIKTGKGVYREVSLQLAAYGMADFVAPTGSPVAYPMPEIDRYAVLHVLENEVREVEIPITTLEATAFLACITLNEWADSMKGRKL